MKKYTTSLIIVILSSLLFSCDRTGQKYVCNCDQLESIRGFIERSIKPANNMSDEEMEDVIQKLWQVGVQTGCQKRLFPINSNGGIEWDKIEEGYLDSCEVAYDWI